MPTDVEFEADLKTTHRAIAKVSNKEAWAAPLAKALEGSLKAFGAAGAKARTAEAVWKKKIGSKSKIVDAAAAAWHAYANHLRADLTTDDLTQAVMPFESAGGLEGALDRLIDAFSKGGIAADVPYARHALAELIPARHTLDALFLETTKEYSAWRSAAGKKNGVRASAWEQIKHARRHLRASAQTRTPKSGSKTRGKTDRKAASKKRPQRAAHAHA